MYRIYGKNLMMNNNESFIPYTKWHHKRLSSSIGHIIFVIRISKWQYFTRYPDETELQLEQSENNGPSLTNGKEVS